MNNRHIIVGEGKRCLCGIYHDQVRTCADFLKDLSILEIYASTSPFIRGNTPEAHAIMDIYWALKPLIQECDDNQGIFAQRNGYHE